jgi:hypothetical protein
MQDLVNSQSDSVPGKVEDGAAGDICVTVLDSVVVDVRILVWRTVVMRVLVVV